MLRLVTDHLKTKRVYKNAIKKLLFVMRLVLGQYTTQEIWSKVIVEKGGIPQCYKNEKMCNQLLIIMFMD